MSDSNPERRRWPPILWGAMALPLWAAGAVLPAGVWKATGGGDPDRLPLEMLVLGLCASTAGLLFLHRRVGPEGTLGWRPAAHWILGASLAAGLGAAILSSELNNVLMAIAGAPANAPPDPRAAPITLALLGLVQPACLVIVLQGVVQRSFDAVIPAKWAIVATLGVAAVFGGGATTRVLPLLVLPAWIFARGRALLPAIAALMPVGIVTALQAFDAGPGISGFDRTGVDAQWQPIWFNALGAGLLALGLHPLLKAWSKP